MAFAIGLVALFWKDITEWLERRRLEGRQRDYVRLEGDAHAERRPVVSTQALRMQLHKTIHNSEGLELQLRIHRGSVDLEAQLRAAQAKRAHLEQVI